MDLTKTNWTRPKRLALDQNYLAGPTLFWTHRRTRHLSQRPVKGQTISQANYGKEDAQDSEFRTGFF